MIPAIVALSCVQLAEGGLKDMRDAICVCLECVKAAEEHGADVTLHPAFKALDGT